MEIKDKTIALLIDSDNVSREYFAILLDELSNYGRVTYRRLYGDFSRPNANGWKPALLEYSIEQIQQIAYTTGKNSSDSSMIIDAMDILYKGKVDCFCLATSDSDFTGLAMRFRNDNIIVIGAGESKTPDSFRKACDRFIAIDELLKAKAEAEREAKLSAVKKVGSPAQTAAGGNINNKTAKTHRQEGTFESQEAKLQKLTDKSKQIISDMSEADGWMMFSIFMQEIYRKENDFNPRLYGHGNGNVAPFFKSLKDKNGGALFILETTNNITKIKLNK
jgi:uncharacterized protein (TIGR00288 family)